jgi:hypothetical protein
MDVNKVEVEVEVEAESTGQGIATFPTHTTALRK